MTEPTDIVHTIRLTEKATLLGDSRNQYVFQVAPRATKPQIKRAVEYLFKKKVASVNTMQYEGKKRHKRRPDAGRNAHWKKAVVTLQEGEKIEFT